MKLSSLEEDFLGDLSQDPHELWEVFAFVRNHFPKAAGDEVLQRGSELLAQWVERGWLTAVISRASAVPLSGGQLLAEVKKLGRAAADPARGTILLDLSDRAYSDVEWLR